MGKAVKLQVTDVQRNSVEFFWPMVLPWLERGIKYTLGSVHVPGVLETIKQGSAQLWVAFYPPTPGSVPKIVAAAVTEMLDFGHKKVAHILLAGGESAEEMLSMVPAIESWARDNGAGSLAATTRQGFKKLLKAKGFAEKTTLVEKLIATEDNCDG